MLEAEEVLFRNLTTAVTDSSLVLDDGDLVPVDRGAVALDAALAEDEVEQRGQHDAALQRGGHRRRPVEPDPHDEETGERPRDEPAEEIFDLVLQYNHK